MFWRLNTLLKLAKYLWVAGLALMAGCSGGNRGPNIHEALYEEQEAQEVVEIHAARDNTHGRLLEVPEGSFHVVQSGLSPGTLIHGPKEHLTLFGSEGRGGLEGPSHLAHPAVGGPRIVSRGGLLTPRDFSECWLLVWFAEARGWTEWDSPWLVCLQRRPVRVRLEDAGLRLTFQGPAGYVFLMPLYGSAGVPKEGRRIPASETGLAAAVRTWEWSLAIPRDALLRARYWASVSREFPLYCEESFSVDRSTDRLLLRRRYEWLSLEDDWNTPHLKVAPVEPALGHCLQSGRLPITLSRPVVDLDVPTPSGPLLGVERVDEYEVRLDLLGLVNSTAAIVEPPKSVEPGMTGIQRKLNEAVARLVADEPDSMEKSGSGQSAGAVLTNAFWLSMSLPFLEPSTGSNAVARVNRLLQQWTNAMAETESSPAELRAILDWPEFLWACSHFTGEWGLARAHWNRIAGSVTGKGIGEESEAADQTARYVFLARLAYQAGDLDRYHYASYLAVKALIHGMAGGGDSVGRSDRPSGSRSERAGEPGGSGLLKRLWSADVARIWNYMPATTEPSALKAEGSMGEMDRLRWHYSFSRDLSFELADERSGDVIRGAPAEVIATCLAVLGRGRDERTRRLIPGGDPSPFVIGLEREVVDPQSGLVVNVGRTGGTDGLELPILIWRTERGGDQSMGSVVVPDSNGVRPGREVLNWKTVVLAAELAAGDVSDPE